MIRPGNRSCISTDRTCRLRDPVGYNVHMSRKVLHDRSAETPEAKARWFQSLSLEERMDLLVEFTELALAACPDLPARKTQHAEPSQ